jgi:hypothetical protein
MGGIWRLCGALIPYGEETFAPGISCPKALPPFQARTNAVSPGIKPVEPTNVPRRGRNGLRPAYGGIVPGLNVIPGKSVIKHKKSVHPNNIAVHQWGGGHCAPAGAT